jgi:hypothetical protein
MQDLVTFEPILLSCYDALDELYKNIDNRKESKAHYESTLGKLIDKLLQKGMEEDNGEDANEMDKFGQMNSLRNPKSLILERIRNELRIRG